MRYTEAIASALFLLKRRSMIAVKLIQERTSGMELWFPFL